MYNLIEYSYFDIIYFEATGSLWLYSKNETTNFNNDIATDVNLKSFKYKAKLLENTVTQPAPNAASGILRNATISVPLKYLINFWRSLELLLITCKVELKIRWKKHCVLSVAGTNNAVGNNDDSNIVFTIKNTN